MRCASGIIGVVIALLSAGVAGAPAAHAGTYVMRNCDVPGKPNSLIGPWTTAEMAPNAVMTDACATGGGVSFSIVGSQHMEPGAWALLALKKPMEDPQREIKLVKASLWYAARTAGAGQPINLKSIDFHSDGTSYPGVSNGPPGAENLVLEQRFSPSTNYYKVGIVCGPVDSAPTPEPCLPSDAVPFQVRGMEVTLSEDTPPSVSLLGGAVLDGSPQSGVRTLAYAAADPQSGLAKVEVLLDDAVVGSNDLTTRCLYSDFAVCPATREETLRVDTRAVANGPHRLAVRVRDAAGNERVVHAEGPVHVANDRPTLVDLRGYDLSARFKGSSRSTLTVPYGRRVFVRGRLTHGSNPLPAGTQLELLERSDRRGAREVSTERVKTKADGSFSLALSTTRPSRKIRLAYRPDARSQVVSRALKLRVRSSSRVRASLRGRVVRFSGRVRSRPIPRLGKLVVMEGRSPGSAWTAFKSLRTDRKGRFSGTYRLRVRRPGVTLKIRAVVPQEGGYGYLGSRSRPATLRVR